MAVHLVGCVIAPVQSCEEGALRLDYRVTIQKNNTNVAIRVAHDLVNISDKVITICMLADAVNFEWTADRSDDAATEGGRTSGGRIACVEVREHFTAIPPRQSIQFNVEEFTVPATISSVTYHASIREFRDGSRLGVRSWTNGVEGSRITIPMN